MDGIVGKSVDRAVTETPARISWIDMCKGFAMLLVMAGHTYAPEWLHMYLYSFHMPLFFFMSGYVFSIRKYNGFKPFFWSRVRTIFLPSIYLGLIISVIRFFLSGTGGFIIFFAKKLAAIFIQLRGNASFDLGLWFFTCLFVVEIAFWVLLKTTKGNDKILTILLVLAASVGYAYHYLIGRICPWSLEVACIAIGFFGAGYLTRKYASDWIQKLADVRFAVGLVALSILTAWLQAGVLGGTVDLYAQEFGVPGLFHLSAFSGILACIAVFQIIGKSRFLEFIGRNTMVYYAFHKVIYAVIGTVTAGALGTAYLAGAVYLMVAVIACAVIAVGVNRYAPWMIGKGKKHDLFSNRPRL